MSPEEIARLIDHTDLRSEATEKDMRRLAEECVTHGFCAACADSGHVPLLAGVLAGTGVRIASVAGFPLGSSLTAAKAFEAERAVKAGAHEVDMVLSVGELIEGKHDQVRGDIRAVRAAVPDAVLKVILECGLLTAEQQRAGALIAVEAGADFVKTSTGFRGGGATVEQVRLLRETVGPDIGVKASGGIRDFEQAAAMVAAGANRIGTSSGVAIVGTGGERGPGVY